MLNSLGNIHGLRLAALVAPAAIVCSAPCLAQDYDDYLGERPERYAMVRLLEGSVKVSKWDTWEELFAGTPIGEGDSIDSNGRGVLQFGDGTRIAFAERTRFDIASLFDDREGITQALLRLDAGRLSVGFGPQSDAHIRIDTQCGSLTLSDRSNVSIEVGSDRSVRIKVFSGSVAFRNRMDAISIRAGERLTIYSDNERLDRVNAFNTYSLDSFESWAERHLAYSQQASRHVPREIRYYADTLDSHGDWVQVVDVGWCWRPRHMMTGWRPYWRGHWGAYRGGMTWVSYDPFGYVTHHYGRWGWSSMHGWYWIPGVYYSPAWVAWNMADSFFGWAPLGYYNHPVYWGYNHWRHDCWNVIDIRYIRNRHVYNHIRLDHSLRDRFPGYQPSRLAPPWRQGPLIITRNEFSNPTPAHFRNAITRDVASERLRAYETQAGRPVVIRRDASPNTVAQRDIPNRPFEDQNTRRVLAERPVMRTPARGTAGDVRTPAPPDRGNPGHRGTVAENSGRDPGTPNRGSARPIDTPPPARTPETRETREPNRPIAPPPSRTTETRDTREPREIIRETRETREPGRYDAPPARPSAPANSGRTETAPSRPAESSPAPREAPKQESQPSRPVGSSERTASPPARTTAPPPSSPSRPSPPPDRSRNLRR